MLFGAPGQSIKIHQKPAPSAQLGPAGIEASNAPKLSGEKKRYNISDLKPQI
jgi:hypothetical protein